MTRLSQKDEDVLPLDAVTLTRLKRFARDVRKPIGEAAAALLRDLLADPSFWDAAEDEVESPPTALN